MNEVADMCVSGGMRMNIEDIEKMKWHLAVIQLLGKNQTSYYFKFDVDAGVKSMKGRLKIEKSVFHEVKMMDIDSEFAVRMAVQERIEFIVPSSQPIVIDESIKEVDFWGIILAQKYFEEFKKTQNMPVILCITREKDGDSYP